MQQIGKALAVWAGLMLVTLHGCSNDPTGQLVNKRSNFVVEGGKRDGSQDATIQNPEDGDPDGSGGGDSPGQQAFANLVTPVFLERCASCHGTATATGIAPQTIYDYAAMRAKLVDGGSAEDNVLVKKIMGQPSHGGGVQCDSMDAQPCKEVGQWWAEEQKPSSESEEGEESSLKMKGELVAVSMLGEATGWVVDEDDLDVKVTVRVFIGGGPGQGTEIGEVTADQPGSGGGFDGDHQFKLQLPDEFLDGKPHQIYVFAVKGDDAARLTGSPLQFTAFKTRADAGEAFYTATLKPMLDNRCSGCHNNINYETHRAFLEEPTPDMGGTATNNLIINRASGTQHPGGNVCGDKNKAPCQQMQEWWRLELAP